MGFDTKHVYVDSVFLCKAGATAEDFQTLANKISEQTGLPMDFDGTIYPWFAFLATRENPNISVANRFYGLSPDGEHKIRGIALRRSALVACHCARGSRRRAAWCALTRANGCKATL